MTTILERLVDQLQRSAEGDAWHGPSVRQVLEGVTVEDASAHPIAGAHGIRELVLHMAAGYHLVLRRLDGDGRQLSPEEDGRRRPNRRRMPGDRRSRRSSRSISACARPSRRFRPPTSTIRSSRIRRIQRSRSSSVSRSTTSTTPANRPAAPGPRASSLT